MSASAVAKEKSFIGALIRILSSRPDTPSREEIRHAAEILTTIEPFEGDLDAAVDEAMVQIDTRMGAGTSLVNRTAKHDEEWVFKRKDIDWGYSDAYAEFLKEGGWNERVVQSLSNTSAKILGYLQDPSSEDSWDRRGLVIGHVQSGKTANYLGVIAKAADAGYKLIIVIAGIHENLRKQTQQRLDEGFLGRSSDPENRRMIGVGMQPGFKCPATLTNVYSDFDKKIASQASWKISNYTTPTVVVIKKNVSTLETLYRWLKQMNAEGDGRIADVPMLMIDDEADNASINTNKEDADPTRTNSCIRKILSLFDKKCYVGYTATPFANIFIDPNVRDEEHLDELFPRDFIYCLDAPTSYFGPNTVFLDDVTSSRIIEPIYDCEDYLPFSHKKDHEVEEIPPSLYRAIDEFIVARAIRNIRGHKNKHCSMMINVSRLKDVQSQIGDFVGLYVQRVSDAVHAYYAMPASSAERNRYMARLKAAFDDSFSNTGTDWITVKQYLPSVFEHLQTYVINSNSQDKLDYKKYEDDGVGLTAIAVGGLTLSRGLTIEGLCVSYMYRNTRMYDTLMQMGRWFGYRHGYEDLCRLYLSPDSIDWYAHIAEASEELRQQVKRMSRDGLSPKEFGLYVKDHPDRLLITAANKMRAGEVVPVSQSYSLKLLESYLLPLEQNVHETNEELIRKYWKSGFGQSSGSHFQKGWFFENVPVSGIEAFLREFVTHRHIEWQKSAALDYLEKIAGDFPTGDVLLLSVSSNDEDKGTAQLGHQRRTCRIKGEAWLTAKHRVASRGDEKYGLTREQLAAAEEIALERGAKAPSDTHYREVRNKPLLMIHILRLEGEDRIQERAPAFGISFPGGNYEKTVRVVANPVWQQLMLGDGLDSPADEEAIE